MENKRCQVLVVLFLWLDPSHRKRSWLIIMSLFIFQSRNTELLRSYSSTQRKQQKLLDRSMWSTYLTWVCAWWHFPWYGSIKISIKNTSFLVHFTPRWILLVCSSRKKQEDLAMLQFWLKLELELELLTGKLNWNSSECSSFWKSILQSPIQPESSSRGTWLTIIWSLCQRK